MSKFEVSKIDLKDTLTLLDFIHKLTQRTKTNRFFEFNRTLPIYKLENADNHYGYLQLTDLINNTFVYDHNKIVTKTDKFTLYQIINKIDEDFNILDYQESTDSYFIGIAEFNDIDKRALVLMVDGLTVTINNGEWRFD